jgi:sulfonate transport system substrate-binding protein
VRIATSGGDLTAEPLYAQSTGIFRRAGIDARLTVVEGGARVMRELVRGSLDVGFSNLISIAAEIQRGTPVVLLAPAGLYSRAAPINAIVQSPDSNFRTGKDLDGKVLASPSGRGSAGAVAPEAWIDAHGGDSSTVRLVTGIAWAEVPAALAAHKIDVAEMGEPELTILKQAGRVKYLASPFDAVGDGFVLGGWVASKAWVRAHPDAARRFVYAMRQTARWANTHRVQSGAILARQLNLSPSVLSAMARSKYAETLSAATLQPALDVAAKYGALKTMDARELLTH